MDPGPAHTGFIDVLRTVDLGSPARRSRNRRVTRPPRAGRAARRPGAGTGSIGDRVPAGPGSMPARRQDTPHARRPPCPDVPGAASLWSCPRRHRRRAGAPRPAGGRRWERTSRTARTGRRAHGRHRLTGPARRRRPGRRGSGPGTARHGTSRADQADRADRAGHGRRTRAEGPAPPDGHRTPRRRRLPPRTHPRLLPARPRPGRRHRRGRRPGPHPGRASRLPARAGDRRHHGRRRPPRVRRPPHHRGHRRRPRHRLVHRGLHPRRAEAAARRRTRQPGHRTAGPRGTRQPLIHPLG